MTTPRGSTHGNDVPNTRVRVNKATVNTALHNTFKYLLMPSN